MKRFITVSAKHAEEILILIRNAAAGAAGVEAYNWLKNKLNEKQVAHNDQHASDHRDLPHQGGYVSFYVDGNGTWMRINH